MGSQTGGGVTSGGPLGADTDGEANDRPETRREPADNDPRPAVHSETVAQPAFPYADKSTEELLDLVGRLWEEGKDPEWDLVDELTEGRGIIFQPYDHLDLALREIRACLVRLGWVEEDATVSATVAAMHAMTEASL